MASFTTPTAPVAQENEQAAYAAPRPAEKDLLSYQEKSTRFEETPPSDRLAAHELFYLFTATIIRERTLFTR